MSESAPQVLFDHPQSKLVKAGDLLISLNLGSFDREWVPSLLLAIEEAQVSNAGPLPCLSVCSLDRRFPFQYDSISLGELRLAARVAQRSMSACAIVLDYGGVLGAFSRAGIGVLGVLGREPPMTTHSRALEGFLWLDGYRAPASDGRERLRRDLDLLHEMQVSMEIDQVA